jgi:hypothetical protein
MRQEALRRRDKIHLFCDLVVTHPPSKAFAPTLGFIPIRDVGHDFGQWHTLAAHDAAGERGQRGAVPGDLVVGLARIVL